LGAIKPQLIKQFLLEAIIISAIASLLAIVLIYLALPAFYQLTRVQLNLSFSEYPLLLPCLIVFVYLQALLPAVILHFIFLL